jgi:hypothetical protein
LRRWSAPIAALVAAIALIPVMVLTSSGKDAATAPQRSVPSATLAAASAPSLVEAPVKDKSSTKGTTGKSHDGGRKK